MEWVSTRQENTYHVLIPVSLVLVWSDNNELAKKGVTCIRPPEEGVRTLVGGSPRPEGNRKDIAMSTPQNDTSLCLMSFAVSAFRIYSREHTLGEGQRSVEGLTERQVCPGQTEGQV